MSASIAVFGCVDEISTIFVLYQLPNISFMSTLIESIIWTLFYADFHYFDFLMLFDNLHVTFKNSRKCPGYYEDFLWRLPIHFILTLADVDFLVFYVNLHVTFRNSRMYPRYTILPRSQNDWVRAVFVAEVKIPENEQFWQNRDFRRFRGKDLVHLNASGDRMLGET